MPQIPEEILNNVKLQDAIRQVNSECTVLFTLLYLLYFTWGLNANTCAAPVVKRKTKCEIINSKLGTIIRDSETNIFSASISVMWPIQVIADGSYFAIFSL